MIKIIEIRYDSESANECYEFENGNIKGRIQKSIQRKELKITMNAITKAIQKVVQPASSLLKKVERFEILLPFPHPLY